MFIEINGEHLVGYSDMPGVKRTRKDHMLLLNISSVSILDFYEAKNVIWSSLGYGRECHLEFTSPEIYQDYKNKFMREVNNINQGGFHIYGDAEIGMSTECT